jgi:hypothetical protein
MMGALIRIGPSFVEPKLKSLFLMWKEVFHYDNVSKNVKLFTLFRKV